MASFPEKYAAGSYTVNAAHAKCPRAAPLLESATMRIVRELVRAGT